MSNVSKQLIIGMVKKIDDSDEKFLSPALHHFEKTFRKKEALASFFYVLSQLSTEITDYFL